LSDTLDQNIDQNKLWKSRPVRLSAYS
jgi:hypothetical protein